MTRSHGRCRKGERLRMAFPHGHRKTTTLVAGLRMTGMVALMVLDGPINGDWFEAYVAQVLVPADRGRPRRELQWPPVCGGAAPRAWRKPAARLQRGSRIALRIDHVQDLITKPRRRSLPMRIGNGLRRFPQRVRLDRPLLTQRSRAKKYPRPCQ